MSIWKYENLLLPIAAEHRLTLGEGETPLIRSRRIGPSLGLQNLYFKLETVNPTGSYKDRYAAAAISHHVNAGGRVCLGTSSGNTGSALAAYSASAGLPCIMVIIETAPKEKLRQMMAYGARLYQIRDYGMDPVVTDRVIEGLTSLAKKMRTNVEISAFTYSPNGMQGVQTISYELAEQLPEGITHVFSPSGGGGLTLAVARGFSLLNEKQDVPRPAVHCVQPTGNNTISGPLRSGYSSAKSCVCTSKISGLQVGKVIDGNWTLKACRESGGTGHVVEDDAVYSMQARLAREEGVFCEPAGAVSATALPAALESGDITAKDTVVCLVTGIGFKDERAVQRMTSEASFPRLDNFASFTDAVKDLIEIS